MGLIVNKYDPYTILDGIEYYTVGTVSKAIGKSPQTIKLWDKWSDELQEQGKSRLIPESTRIGNNYVRCWTINQILEIKEYSNSIKYGDLAPFSRTRWGEKAKYLTEDRSTAARNAKKNYRNQVNKNSKKIQHQRKISEIKIARSDMLKTVRRRAKSLYNEMELNRK